MMLPTLMMRSHAIDSLVSQSMRYVPGRAPWRGAARPRARECFLGNQSRVNTVPGRPRSVQTCPVEDRGQGSTTRSTSPPVMPGQIGKRDHALIFLVATGVLGRAPRRR